MRDGKLIQEEWQLGDELDPWRVVVASLLCQRTTGKAVRPVLEKLFEQWPAPAALAHAGTDLEDLIRPLGLVTSRCRSLRSVGHHFSVLIADGLSFPPSAEWLRGITGVGDYTVEAYKFVVFEDRSFRPKDKELRKAWNRDRGFGVPGARPKRS